MNLEQRLTKALGNIDRVEPSVDLWARVVHSIDEDRLHRLRTRRSVVAVVATIAAFAVAVSLFMVDGAGGHHVDELALEIIQTVLLVALAGVLAPAIRRFGRGYAHDLWPQTPAAAASILKLLDIAYGLIVSGYVLVTMQFDAELQRTYVLSGQLAETFVRVGGLVLVIGLLHAVTIVVLPFVALVFNSTRTNRPLPRWVTILLVLVGVGGGFFLLDAVIGLAVAGLS